MQLGRGLSEYQRGYHLNEDELIRDIQHIVMPYSASKLSPVYNRKAQNLYEI